MATSDRRHKARDWLRKRAREPELVDDLESSELGATELDLPPLPAGEVLDEVRRLRPAYRLVVVLSYVLDYTPAEIAAALEIPAPTVRTRLRRALIGLRRAVEMEEANDAIAP